MDTNLIAAKLSYHSYLVDNDEVREVMREAAAAIEELASKATEPKAAPTIKTICDPRWVEFVGALKGRAHNALLNAYGYNVDCLETWAKKTRRSKIAVLPNVGKEAMKSIDNTLASFDLALAN
jgi:hypothetical protein